MNSRLRTVHLEGQLKEVCGGNSTVTLVGDSLPILISGLASMYGQKVKEICRENNWHVYLDSEEEGNDIGNDQVNHHLMETKDVYLYPAVEGSGKAGQIVLGIIMIVVGVLIIMASWGTLTPQGLAAMGQGALMIVGGLSTIYMAMSAPKAQSERAAPDEKASFIFNGAANVIEQGGAVSCVYGRFRTGSTVVSAGLDTGEMVGNGQRTGGGNGGGQGDGCVTTDSHIQGYGLASTVMVGDYMNVIDPVTYEVSKGKVTQALTVPQPCVRITSESGIVLECSTTAPIADAAGNEVLAPNLLGVSVLVSDNGTIKTETVVSVENIGVKDVVFITCENNFFLAGAEQDKYFFHHNYKYYSPYDGNPAENPLFGIGPL